MKNKWLRRKVLAIILVLAMCPVPVYSEGSCEHNYVENSRVDPTCTSTGQIVWECSKCHDMQTETLPQAAHNYVETVMVAPTCKGKYASDFKCSSCGDSYTEVYDPLPHNPVVGNDVDNINMEICHAVPNVAP